MSKHKLFQLQQYTRKRTLKMQRAIGCWWHAIGSDEANKPWRAWYDVKWSARICHVIVRPSSLRSRRHNDSAQSEIEFEDHCPAECECAHQAARYLLGCFGRQKGNGRSDASLNEAALCQRRRGLECRKRRECSWRDGATRLLACPGLLSCRCATHAREGGKEGGGARNKDFAAREA